MSRRDWKRCLRKAKNRRWSTALAPPPLHLDTSCILLPYRRLAIVARPWTVGPLDDQLRGLAVIRLSQEPGTAFSRCLLLLLAVVANRRHARIAAEKQRLNPFLPHLPDSPPSPIEGHTRVSHYDLRWTLTLFLPFMRNIWDGGPKEIRVVGGYIRGTQRTTSECAVWGGRFGEGASIRNSA